MQNGLEIMFCFGKPEDTRRLPEDTGRNYLKPTFFDFALAAFLEHPEHFPDLAALVMGSQGVDSLSWHQPFNVFCLDIPAVSWKKAGQFLEVGSAFVSNGPRPGLF